MFNQKGFIYNNYVDVNEYFFSLYVFHIFLLVPTYFSAIFLHNENFKFYIKKTEIEKWMFYYKILNENSNKYKWKWCVIKLRSVLSLYVYYTDICRSKNIWQRKWKYKYYLIVDMFICNCTYNTSADRSMISGCVGNLSLIHI